MDTETLIIIVVYSDNHSAVIEPVLTAITHQLGSGYRSKQQFISGLWTWKQGAALNDLTESTQLWAVYLLPLSSFRRLV